MGGVLGPYLELDPINSIQIPSSKLTWQWRSTFSSRKCITNDGISMNFHCYVSLPECTKNSHIQQKVKPSRWVSFRSFSWGCTLKKSSFAMSPTSQNIHNIYIYKRLDNVLRVQIGDVEQLPHPNSMDIPSANPGQVEFFLDSFV